MTKGAMIPVLNCFTTEIIIGSDPNPCCGFKTFEVEFSVNVQGQKISSPASLLIGQRLQIKGVVVSEGVRFYVQEEINGEKVVISFFYLESFVKNQVIIPVGETELGRANPENGDNKN